MGDGERNESWVPTMTKIVTLPYYFIYTSANPQFDFVIDVIAVLQNLSSLIIPLPPEWKWYKYCTRISISYMINKIIHISIRRREQCYCKGISYESIRTVYIPFHFHEQTCVRVSHLLDVNKYLTIPVLYVLQIQHISNIFVHEFSAHALRWSMFT